MFSDVSGPKCGAILRCIELSALFGLSIVLFGSATLSKGPMSPRIRIVISWLLVIMIESSTAPRLFCMRQASWNVGFVFQLALFIMGFVMVCYLVYRQIRLSRRTRNLAGGPGPITKN